ncbi:MAG: serine/threonine-protein phosphatase, partial [Pedosphaera parvula]|nr:serine/threonine-protein phosphatase [Pedosphaera parvula]
DVLPVEEHGVLLIIADVMGKGIPAAMFAAILRSLLRAVPEWTSEPAAVLSRINSLLFEELSGVDMFITEQLVYVDTRQQQMVAASAGHCPILVARELSGTVEALSPEGLPLGVLPDTHFVNAKEALGKNQRLLLYTDGLTEARNTQGEFFGQERLAQWFRQSLAKEQTAEQLKQELTAELAAFQGTSALRDDQTFLIMAR